MPEFVGQTIILTEVIRGLGESIAVRFANQSANVVLIARREERHNDIASRIEGDSLVVPTDVSLEDDVKHAIHRALDEYGSIATLANNAGVGLMSLYRRVKETAEILTNERNQILEGTLRGPVLFPRAVLLHFEDQECGNIINVSSTFATQPKAGWGRALTGRFGDTPTGDGEPDPWTARGSRNE